MSDKPGKMATGLKKGATGYVVITLVVIAALFIFRDNNVLSWISARREIRNQERLARRYAREIVETTQRINNLKSNKDSLEKLAREEYHLCAPGEDVYLVEENTDGKD